MDDKDLTGWFPHETKPVHHGWYQVRDSEFHDGESFFRYAHWNGVRWSQAIGRGWFDAFTTAVPEYLRREPQRRYSKFQCWEWRGLTAPAS